MALHGWRGVFLGGLGLWVASVIVLAATQDGVLLPSVVLLGSFLVPVTAVFWFVGHDHDTELSPERLASAFFGAGVLGLLAAASMETWLLPTRMYPNAWVGLIEEAVKAVGVIVFARGLHRYTIRDGILLGTTIGLGFGAFEASGYTLNYGFSSGNFSLADMLNEEILRAVIAPFCHGIWTGLFGAAWFAGRGRARWGALGAYVGVATMHALWDASSTAGIVVTVLINGDQGERDDLAAGILPSPGDLAPQWLYGAVSWGIMILIALIGVLLVRRAWAPSRPPSPSRSPA